MVSEPYNSKLWKTLGWKVPIKGDYCLCYDINFKKIVTVNDGSINKKCYVLEKIEK